MSVTYGFYNSLNHDRKYDAIQMSSIFDGVINDGIYMSIGDQLRVSAGVDMTVIVGTGRAWFNHTWTLNDARLPLTLEQSEVILKRIDLVILEVNADPAVRQNSIKILKGIPSQNPAWPTIINEGFLHQYVLAAISVAPNATAIRQADIENRVGMGTAPFVTGIIETINTDALIDQWKDQWQAFYEKQTADIINTKEYWKAAWEMFYTSQTESIQNAFNNWQAEWESWSSDYEERMENWANTNTATWDEWFNNRASTFEIMIESWYNREQQEFNKWFGALQDLIDSNAETNLANAIIALEKRVDKLGIFRQHLDEEQALYYELKDSDSEPILDSQGRTIDARLIFVLK